MLHFKPTHSLGTVGVKLLLHIKYRHHESLQEAMQMAIEHQQLIFTVTINLGT